MELKVNGMNCGGCVNSVTRILSKNLELDESTVDVDLESGRATIPSVDDAKLEVALEKLAKAGFPTVRG